MFKYKIGIQKNTNANESWWVRLGWLVAIWSMSVLTLAVIAFAIRKFMTAAGMSI
jgi:hypothetical protein